MTIEEQEFIRIISISYCNPNCVISLEDIKRVEEIMFRELHSAPELLFWYWIQERHSIFLKRQRGESKPWTEDPILQNYKFLNPFRENDRGTVWLRENFLIPHREDSLELLAFNICWYRMFNWIGTGELLGWQIKWNSEEIKRILNIQEKWGLSIFTNAYVVRSEQGIPKIDSIVSTCNHLWENRYDLVGHEKLETVFQILIKFISPFMSYEIVTDMRHTRLLETATDINTFSNAGPGALRGLKRLGLSIENPLDSMIWLLNRDRTFLNLELRDIEHSLCEWDKYCRVKFGEGKPRFKFNGEV